MRFYFLLTIAALAALAGCAQPVSVPSAVATIAQVSPIKLADAVLATDTPVSNDLVVSKPAATETSSLATHTRPPTNSFTPTPVRSPTRVQTRTPTRTATPRRTPTPYPAPSGNITRIVTTLRSASLQLDRELIIYLPPGYSAQSQRRYPVLYFLHGYGGFDLQHTTEWEGWGFPDKVQELTGEGAIQPMIVVQPNGFMLDGQSSLFFNHGPGTDGKPWGDYIWKDVVNYVDANYRTIPRRESRAIAGFSFGGQGALSLALTHPEVFKVVGAHSPSFRGADGSISYINDWNWFNRFDPIWLVQNTDHAKQLSLWIDVATGDDKVRNCGAGSDRCVEAFHALLVDKGIPHEWHDAWPGPHEWTYWQPHFPDYLAWYSSQLIGQ